MKKTLIILITFSLFASIAYAGIVPRTKYTSFTPSTRVDITDGLVGRWSFDGPDVSGTTIFDRYGKFAENGTFQSTPRFVPGKFGQAAYFSNNGVTKDDVYISTANGQDFYYRHFQPMTVSVWFKADNFNSAMTLVGNFYDDAQCEEGCIPQASAFYIRLDSATSLTTQISTTNDNLTATSFSQSNAVSLIPGKWYNATMTYDNTTLRAYLDGVLIGSIAATGEIVFDTTNSARTTIGCYYQCLTSNQFVGAIDEVRFYNRALSADEIKRLDHSLTIKNKP